ncbi:YciI family protein [Rhodospirillaceae bacterium SYSU D60014]|uniref:YciI family protein n=1 Tax=Virgifigura deserti TaxID=2268457 RepID=UPI000E66D333
MQFMIYCLDKPGQAAVRAQNRDAHLAYLKGFADRVVVAGPLLNEDGGMIGSLLLMAFASRSEAEAFVAGDPYGKAGLFQSVTVTPWKKVLP